MGEPLTTTTSLASLSFRLARPLLLQSRSLQPVIFVRMSSGGFDYDYAVIGGGSGGLASAKKAASLGAKVVLFDFVVPSTQGTKWGLGGTCVNVGCVPKKLMHYAGIIGHQMSHDAHKYGWNFKEQPTHDWLTLKNTVQNHVKSLNFGYRNGLRSNQVEYINALARFSGANELSYELRGETKKLTAAKILIAVGGRPSLPSDVPGAVEHAITSDDLFALNRPPGRTLCVGGSYIALECAGFLTELGFDTTVAVRSIVLRGFDRQCSEKIATMMDELGTNFRYGVIPSAIIKQDDGKLCVSFKNSTTGADEGSDVFDTVLYAVGREAFTKNLNLEAVGVKTLPNGKIDAVNEQTNVENIFAVGDVLHARPELTPVAIQAGELLALRLFAGKTGHMDYDNVPTTVFTPLEYGAVGLSEEEAIARFGKDDIETYLFEFSSLEAAAAHRTKHPSRYTDETFADLSPTCLSKLVCVKSQNERVVGFHYVGPNAGEITQGFAIAVRLGAKKQDFDQVVGIHPTDAESFTSMDVTRSSGSSWVAAGGCGGGKCG
eukprot:c675_g1_i1.p1 GENE.c675_g1_i1~~c675_g1_i1.p1  ORF type:complete len:547 (-),score=122.21 c675_g1_i1:129-1769(-)